MEKIFRYANKGLLLAAILAVGAVAGFAQDPCADADAITKLGDQFRAEFADKTLPGRKKAIDTGKQFLEKYGSCTTVAAELIDYLNKQLPGIEKRYKDAVAKQEEEALVKRFNAALAAKTWDEVYAAGKELLQKNPEQYRPVQLVLGSIGYDESYKGNNKYNDETIRFAKVALADLEAGKTFSTFSLPGFVFKSKDDAIGWMNLTIGYIMHVGQKNKAGAAPYLYKATQASSDTAKNPIPFELIGSYYFDELNKIVDQIQAKAKDQKDTDPPDVAQKKVDELKALVAMSNGTAERAMDAFSRAYTLAKDATYKAKMKKNVEDAYFVRLGKKEPVDAWIATAVTKPFPNPTTPITPITDPDPVTTTTSTAPTTPAPIKPTVPPAKPGTVTKPAAAPVKSGTKVVGSGKKAVAKKRVA